MTHWAKRPIFRVWSRVQSLHNYTWWCYKRVNFYTNLYLSLSARHTKCYSFNTHSFFILLYPLVITCLNLFISLEQGKSHLNSKVKACFQCSFSIHLDLIAMCVYLGQVLLWILRSSKVMAAPPTLVGLDTVPSFFKWPSRFNVKVSYRHCI